MSAPLLTAEIATTRLEICVADITTLDVEAVVERRQPHAAGRRRRRRRHPSRRGTGPSRRVSHARRLRHRLAKITHGYRLKAKHVIHAVGPVWGGGKKGEEDLLASCYRTALVACRRTQREFDCLPAISTGVYRFPPSVAARIAVGTVAAEIAHAPRGIARVVFCCFSPDSAEHHTQAFTELGLA
jgi:O-acetyl-ADP-ribose deacetylase (regulator of RNase III)